jgi:hypothetical protein
MKRNWRTCREDKEVSLTGGLLIRRLLRSPRLYDWAEFYFRHSPAERVHQLLKDTLSFKLGWKPDDISHVFVILATKRVIGNLPEWACADLNRQLLLKF